MFDWTNYFVLAQELAVSTEVSEYQDAKLRSAISRAYYAAFCKARNCLSRGGISVPNDGSAHKFVKERFKNSDIKTRRKIGLHLERLKRCRRQADYEDVIEASALVSMTQTGLNEAGQILIYLENLMLPAS